MYTCTHIHVNNVYRFLIVINPHTQHVGSVMVQKADLREVDTCICSHVYTCLYLIHSGTVNLFC